MKALLYLFLSSIFFTSAFAANPSSQLTYQYTIPYSGGATLTLSNTGNTPVTITTLSFANNAEISGTPWGSLWGWQSTVTDKLDSDNVHIMHTIKETPNVTIAPQQSVTLTYTLGKVVGKLSPFKAAMDPVSVMVNGESVPIKGLCSGAACKDPGNGKRILGYFPNWAFWRSPQFTAEKVPYNKINMIDYAFVIFDQDGKVSLYDQDSDAVNIPIISQKRKQYPYLNASLSFGGWSWFSTPPGWSCPKGDSPEGPAACFSKMAANPDALRKFVGNAISAMKEVNFNGIDIDWEYPNPADTANFVKLLQLLRSELDLQSAKDHIPYHLTIAVGAGIDKIQTISKEQWQLIAKLVDHIGVMTYDFHGAWDQGQVGSNFMSAMQLDPIHDSTSTSPVLGKYSLNDALKGFTDRGIPANKLIVGVPIYGRMVNIASAGNSFGLYQTITNTPKGEWDNQLSGPTGMLGYNCIADRSTCGNGYVLPNLNLVDPTTNPFGQYSLTPWGYTNNLFITYDDAKSATYKANWVIDQKFAGIMMWDLTGDFPAADQRSIVNAVYQTFNQ